MIDMKTTLPMKKVNFALLVALLMALPGAYYFELATGRLAPLKHTIVRGGDSQSRALAEQLLAEAKGGSIFSMDIVEWKARLEALPGVQKAHVRMRLPSTLLVRLSAAVPLARWQDGSLIDAQGGRYTGSINEALPVFRGDAARLADMVAFYRVANQLMPALIAQVEVRAYGGWQIFLTDGTLVRLGRQPLRQLQRFVRHAPALAAQLPPLRVVDMRYTRGFSVQVRREEDEV